MRDLFKIFNVFAIVFSAAFFGSSAAAQGWRMFIDDVKREAQEKKIDENDAAPIAQNVRNSQNVQIPQIPAPPIDSTRPSGADATLEPPSEPTPRDVRSSVSDGGGLHFSDVLTDDAAALYGDAENEPAPVVSRGVYTASPPPYRNFPEMKNDARLNDVCFVSRTRGWAVGDRGAIWSTSDGGANWRLVDSPTDANLFAVSFLDENFGLAVGGRVLPSTRVGRGVILRTIDGGATWGAVETASFPILRDVKILDEGTAWIAGDSSELYPSGLFVSGDSGLNWDAEPGNRRAGWRSILFDPIEKIGVGATVEGGFQTVAGASAAVRALPIGTRRLRDVAYDGASGTVWLVGESGTAARSTDFGKNWAQTPGALPNGAERFFDFESVATRDGFVGAVGSPGTLFFYSNDGGNVWNASRTGTRAPLRKVFFVDRSTGWAVGEFGTIVATVDGGQSWTVQRDGGERAALLGIFGRGRDVPFESLVRFAGDEGYLTEVCLTARETENESTSAEIPLVERLNEAVVESGASGSTQSGLFSLDPTANGASLEQILERFDRENDGDGLERFREYLVRQLRVWRPNVLLTVDSLLETSDVVAELPANVDLSTSQGTRNLIGALVQDASRLQERPRDPFRTLILRELPFAIQAAGDPTSYPEHLTVCGLEPWNVSKVQLVCGGKTQGNLLLDASYFCASLGRPVGEIAANAREIVDFSATVATTTNFQTLFGANLPDANGVQGAKSFFAGISIPKGSDARRAPQTELSQYVDALSARAGDRRQKLGVVDSLTRASAKNRKSGEILSAQLRKNIQNVDEEFAIDYLSQAGRNFAALGNWPAAEEAFSLVALEFPANPKNREALTWLIQYYCGSEPFWRTQEENRRNETTVDPTRADGNAAGNAGGAKDSRSTLALDESATSARSTNAAQLGEAIRTVAPETYMSPEIRFPLAAAQRRRGDVEGAARFYLNRAFASKAGVWGARAAAEYRLLAPNGEQTSPFAAASCRVAPGRPYLDGELEPTVWDAAARFALGAPIPELPATRALDDDELAALAWRTENRKLSTPFGTTVSLLRDSQFLYVGVVCPKSAAFSYPTANDETEKPRARDGDLSAFDRVEFQLDLDGDYATAYRFSFDCRGWAADSLWNDSTWSPEIFVAKKESNVDWSLEIAIPLEALAQKPPKNGDVWRFAARRIVPGVGVECWNVENSERGENAFGFLTFTN